MANRLTKSNLRPYIKTALWNVDRYGQNELHLGALQDIEWDLEEALKIVKAKIDVELKRRNGDAA